MTKEYRITEIQMANVKGNAPTPEAVVRISDIRVSLVIRHSDFVIAPRLVCSLKFAVLSLTSGYVTRFQKEEGEGHHARRRSGLRRPQAPYDRSEFRPRRRQPGNASGNDREGRQDQRKA